MIFRPDIKPPMWGPPDAVQYAVMANAERLELSPLFVSPLWEGGGLALDYANGLSGQLTAVSAGVPAWKSGGVDFGWVSSTSYGYVDFQRDFTLPADFTIAFDYIAGTYRQYQGLITSGGFGHGWSVYQYAAGAYETWRVILPGKTLSLYLPITTTGTRATIVVTQKSGVVRMYKNGVESTSGGVTGATVAAVGDSPLRLGCRSATNDAPEYGADCIMCSALIVGGSMAPDEYHATPYALLMPVSRPVYFDLVAGGGTTGTFVTPSQSTTPSVSAGSLAGVSAGTFQAPSLSTQPAVSSGVLVGQAGGNFTGPSLFAQPSVSAGSLVGLSAGSFTSPGASTQPTVAAGSLTGQQSGAFAAPSVSAQPSVQAGALLGSQSGNFLGPSLVVSSSVTAATLQSLGGGLFSAPQVATRPVVAMGSLIGASVGAAQAPSLSTAPVISAGVLVGNQSGNFLGPSLSLRSDVEAGTLAGVAASSGVFVSPQLSLHALVLAGVLVGDAVTILPEEFNANSRITNHFAANSLITTEFVAVSRLELGRIQNNG